MSEKEFFHETKRDGFTSLHGIHVQVSELKESWNVLINDQKNFAGTVQKAKKHNYVIYITLLWPIDIHDIST